MAIKNPFNFSDKYENPNRNTFEVSYQNNVTFNLGEIIPIQCKEVLPNTTVSFDTTLGLSFMPLIFPVQTRMRAEVKSFYVRNRTLWRDWQDFIGKTKDDLVPPYLAKNDKIKTGSLSDYLGLSTTLHGSKTVTVKQKFPTLGYTNMQTTDSYFGYNLGNGILGYPPVIISQELQSIGSSLSDFVLFNSVFNSIRNAFLSNTVNYESNLNQSLSKSRNITVRDDLTIKDDFNFTDVYPIIDNEIKIRKDYLIQLIENSSNIKCGFYLDGKPYIDKSNIIPLLSGRYFSTGYISNVELFVRYKSSDDTTNITSYVVTYDSSGDLRITGSDVETINELNVVDCLLIITMPVNNVISSGDDNSFNIKLTQYGVSSVNTDIDTSIPIESTDVVSPYYDEDTNPDGETITCLAHRAYESIYNYWYRDSRNNPRIVNGQPEYNKFITTDNGGIDRTDYHIFHDNWEQDFLTTAVQSPQQGIAPLVGITSYGEFQFKDEDGNVYSAQAEFDSDGDTITGFGVLSPDMPQGNKRQLVNLATYGISISDLRNVNALQRWLEINMRRGLRYQDQIKSHFGVDTKYKDYMYPEFIGGHNEEIYIKEVDQTVPTNETPLGWKAGQATSFGSSRNRVTHFCDEHGFIITCIVVKPVANYSQLVPKHFYKKDTLDYYFPEFGHLSMQPIPYREVAPIQAVNEFDLSKLNETFGYQRAWYEYFNATDEIHGLFRTNLRNFVVQRQFTSLPELGNDFLTVNHEELDDIFAVSSDDVNHKIIGQIYFDYKIKLPIPKYGIPRLEA